MPSPWFKARLQEPMLGRHFFAAVNGRLALPWTYLFLRLGLRPNTISLMSLAISILGAYLIAFDPGPRPTVWFGALLMMVGIWWDHSDGQVARATGTGTLRGALLDTVIDRWVETLWLLALAAGPFLGSPREIATGVPRPVGIVVGVWVVHAMLYYRWITLQYDIYVLRKELEAARTPTGIHADIDQDAPAVKPRMFYIPLAPSRDLAFWILFAITIVPYWLEGLIAFAVYHTLLGFERTYYAFRDLKRPTSALRAILHPDYHR